MRFQNLFVILLFVLSTLLVGCPSGEKRMNDSNQVSTNSKSNSANKSKSKTKPPLEVETPTPRKEINKAEKVAPVVAAYCAAIRRKDDDALEKVYTKAVWKTLKADAREEGKSSVAAYLSESEPVGNKCDVINEKIGRNVGYADVTTETYPNGIRLKFVKENGAWKLTNQSADFEEVRKSSGK